MERLLPQNLEAERATLASILIDPSGMREATRHVQAEDFYREKHRQTFEAMQHLHERGEPVDILTVGEEMERRGTLTEDWGYADLSEMTNHVPTSVNLAYYAKIVAHKALMRRLIVYAGKVASVAYDESDDALSATREMLRAVENRRTADDSVTFAQAVDAWLEDAYGSMERREPSGVTSGFRALDDLVMGFKPGDLWYIPGRPGCGKSVFGLAVAEYNAKRFAAQERGTVEYVTLEMTATQQVQRIIAARANINGRTLRSEFYHDGEFQEAFFRAAEKRALDERARIGAHLRFYDKPLKMDELAAHLTRAVEERECRLAVIDYLGLVEVDDARADEYKRITQMSRALKQLAMRLRIPILCLVQMNRESEKRENKRPMLSDLRDSGSLEQDADGVIGLYRPAYYDPQRAENDPDFARFMELWIIKARGSIGVGFAPASFEGEYTRMSSWAEGTPYPADDTRPGSKASEHQQQGEMARKRSA